MPRKTYKPVAKKTVAKKDMSVREATDLILRSKDSPVDVRDLAYELFKQAGGHAGFAKLLYDEFESLPVGSLARVRIFELMVRLGHMATPKEKFGDPGHLTDDDLDRVIREQLKRMDIHAERADEAKPDNPPSPSPPG